MVASTLPCPSNSQSVVSNWPSLRNDGDLYTAEYAPSVHLSTVLLSQAMSQIQWQNTRIHTVSLKNMNTGTHGLYSSSHYSYGFKVLHTKTIFGYRGISTLHNLCLMMFIHTHEVASELFTQCNANNLILIIQPIISQLWGNRVSTMAFNEDTLVISWLWVKVFMYRACHTLITLISSF